MIIKFYTQVSLSGKDKASKEGKRCIFEYKHENLARLFFGMVRNFLAEIPKISGP